MALVNSKQLKKPISGSFTGSFSGDGSGLINISSSISSSFATTASYASNVPLTASYALTASNAISASYSINAQTASYITQAQSASYWSGSIINAATASYVLNAISASYAATSSYADNFTVRDNLTAQTLTATSMSLIGTGSGGDSAISRFSYSNADGVVSYIQNTSPTGWTSTRFLNSSGVRIGSVGAGNASASFLANSTYLFAQNGNSLALATSTGPLPLVRLYITPSTGNVLINTATDLGYKLNINGSGTLSGSLFVSGSSLFSGSVISTLGFTGSLSGTAATASYVLNAQSASYIENAQTASYVLQAVSASYAATASFVAGVSDGTASLAISSSYAATASSADNFLVRGTLTAQTINVQTITSSIDFVTGSTRFGTTTDNTHQFTGSVSISGSLGINGVDYNLTSASFDTRILNTSSSLSTLSSSYLASSASFDTRINANSSSVAQLSGSYLADSSSFAARVTDNSASIAQLSGSYLASSASFDTRINVISSSYATTGSNVFKGNQTITGSFAVSGSTIQVGNNTLLGNTTLSGSIIITGSVNAQSDINLGGLLRLNPAIDPGTSNLTASFLFTSASNTATGFDLYYRQNGNLVKFKWFEGALNTGVLYGGILTYSASNFYISSGSGIIVNHNATTGSEISPTITYVNWAASTHSVSNPSAQNTYVFIDSSGNLQQQTSFFTPEQYHEALPIGRISHYGATGSLVTGVGNNMLTAYDVPQQLAEFTRAFGPLKVSGFTITPQVGNLHLNIGSGTAYNLGGYYQNSPDLPSIYNSNTYLTSSIIRLYRSGSGFQFDNNGGSYYTSVDPLVYDNGTGTLATVGNGNWSIQRVFVNPITGRSHVYYGQSTYTTYLNAVQSVATDDFIESEVTKNAYVFAGYLVMQGGAANDDLSVGGTTNAIIQSGLFRNSVGGSGGATTAVSDLNDLADVNITSPANGQALVYNSGIWVNGNPSSASYAATSSYADNFTVGNTLTAQRIVVQTISSSIVYSSGSNRFGNELTNTQVFTGSLSATGSNHSLFGDVGVKTLALTASFEVNGSARITGSVEVQPYLNQIGNATTTNRASLVVQPNEFDNSTTSATTNTGIISSVTNKGSSSGGISTIGGQFYSRPYGTSTGYVAGYGLSSYAVRNNALDTSTNATNQLVGLLTNVGHQVSLNGLATTVEVRGIANSLLAATGSITNTYGQTTTLTVGTTVGRVATVTNFYGLSTSATVGATSGTGSGTLTNYYDIYLQGATVQSTGVVTNKWGVYQLNSAHANYFAGNVGIGKIASSSLDVSGSVLITGSLNVSSGITGSLSGTATTASYVQTAQTSSYVLQAVSASFATNAIGAFIQGGNSFGTAAILGTNDVQNLSLETSGSTRLFISSSGNIGIGTTTLSEKLNVFGYGSFGSSNAKLVIGSETGSDPVIKTTANTYLRFNTGDADRVLIHDTGMIVGSNLTLSGYEFGFELNVLGLTKSYVYSIGVGSDYGGAISSGWATGDNINDIVIDGNRDIIFKTNGLITSLERVRLTASGNVGIGTSNPNAKLSVNGNTAISGSLFVSGSSVFSGSVISTLGFTGSLLGTATTASFVQTAQTASYVLNAVSASYAVTSSYSNNLTVAGTFTFDGTLTDYSSVASSIVGSNNIFTQATGSYRGAFYKYTLYNGTNARSGEIMAVWNAGSVQYTDVSTLDVGTTSNVTASVAIVTAQAQLNFQTNTSGWTIKVLSTYI
jgi:hypothetical protein